MFVQVIQGPVSDREAVRRMGERWNQELRPGADGFLGGTVGITDDGWLVNSARFESEEAARRNSDRPEQGAWWSEFSKVFSAEPTFVEGSDVDLHLDGGRDDAGFVQVMIGKATDRAAITRREQELVARLKEFRPEYVGGLRLWHGDDEYVEFAYFTNEADARGGESKPIPDDLAADFQSWQEASGDVTYRDLREVITF